MAGQRARALIGACAVGLLLLSPNALAAEPWTQFRGGPAKTGLSLDTAAERDIGWVFVSPTDTQIVASPVTDGASVITAEYNGVVSALDIIDGSLRWTYRASDLITATPAVVNTTVLVPTGKRLLALEVDSSGTRVSLAWSFNSTARMDSSPTIARGAVFIGSDDRNLYKLDLATGALLWNFSAGDAVKSSPAVVGATVYFGSYDGFLYALQDQGTSASLLWKYNAQGEIASSPAVEGGMVYTTTLNGHVVGVVATTGARAWEASPGGVIVSSPAVSDGQIFVGGDALSSFDATTGATLWERTLGGYVRSSPAVHGGLVFCGDYAGRVFAYHANGTLAWSYDTGAAVRTSPALGAGLLLVANDGGRLLAVPLAAGDPPTVHPLVARTTFSGVTETFTSSASDPEGKDLFFLWDFGDGTTAPGQSVKHTFNAAGNFTVTLRVSDGVLAKTQNTTVTVKPFASTVSGGGGGANSPTGGVSLGVVAGAAIAAVAVLLALVFLLRRRAGAASAPPPEPGTPAARAPPAAPAASQRGPRAHPPPASSDAQRRAELDYYAKRYSGGAQPPSDAPARAPRPPKT